MNYYPKFSSGSLITKIESFQEAKKAASGNELSEIIWRKSLNFESWLIRRTNFAQTLAVMSVVGYILGLGDRHTNNIMMDRQNGKIIHIDYGDCFEVAMLRKKFPERIPFRLTRMFVDALGISGVEGAFKIICENATIHMLMSQRRFQFGLIRALIPILAPGSVNAKITIIAIMINTAGIKIFEASPIPLSIDLWEINHKIIHEITTPMHTGMKNLPIFLRFSLPPTFWTKYAAVSVPQPNVKLLKR